MRPWKSRFALLALSAFGLALPGCGGGGDIDAEAGTEPVPMSSQLQPSERALDLGVVGDGLFVLQAAPGAARTYSRLGRLDLDRSGNLIHADGGRVLGVTDDPALDAAPLPAAPLAMAARASRRSTIIANLDSRTPTHDTAVAFDPDDASMFDSAISFTVWSDDGHSHAVCLYFQHFSAPKPPRGEERYWIVRASVDGFLAPTLHVMNFGPTGAALPASESVFALPAADTGLPHDMEIDFAGTTEYGASFGVTDLRTDGYPPGALASVSVEFDGRLVLRYDNGQVAPGGRLVLARFTVADRVRRVGESSWVCGPGCSAPTLGTPGSALLGVINAGAINTVY